MIDGKDRDHAGERGGQCFGGGPLIDLEEARKGFGAHSDQERILEEALYRFIRFKRDVVVELAGKRP